MDELQQHLKKLESVKKGDKLRAVLTADRMNALQGAVRCLAKGDAIKTDGGLSKTSTTNAVILRGPGKTDEFVPQLEPFEVRVLGLPASYLTSYSPGHYVTCNLGYVTNLFDGVKYRPSAVTYNAVVQSTDDINGSLDMGWFNATSLLAGGADVYVWLEYVTNRAGNFVTSPTYEYAHTAPSIWFTASSSPPITCGLHGYESHQYRFICVARVSYDSTLGWVVTQYHKGNVLVESNRDINNRLYENRHPFEVYETEGEDGATAKFYMAWGTVCRGDEKNAATTIQSGGAGMDPQAAITLTSGQSIWLECLFETNGSFTCYLKTGTWAYNCSYVNGPGTGQNTWYHPIAHYRASRTGLPESTPDSGEQNQPPDSGYTIAQLTNTHLVGQQQCMTDYGGTTRTAWKLVPGPGALTGTTSGAAEV